MKKVNFEIIFKIIVLIQLTIILLLLLFPSNNNTENYESKEIGRYKEIKIKCEPQFGGALEKVRILDTQTGFLIDPSE